MQSVSEALAGTRAGSADRRTGQQVHRYTRTQRGQEGRYWQPFNPKDTARVLQAAEKFDRVARLAHRTARNGRQNGGLGHIGLEVLRELLRLIDYRSGRLDPAIATIARRIGRSIAAVAAALQRLKTHGFLDWLRRYVPTGQQGLRGPQVQQTSNAYRIMVPTALLAAIQAPPPEDDTDRRAGETAAYAGMLRQLTPTELVRTTIDDGPLAGALARMAAYFEQKLA